MVLRYEMQPDGTAKAFWLRWHRSIKFKLAVLGVGLCPSVFAFAMVSSAGPHHIDVALLISLVVEGLSPFLFSRLLASSAKRGWRVLSIDADGMTTQTAGGEWHAPWREVREVVVTTEYTFLLGAGINSLAIPAAAFADASDREEFVRRATRYIAAAAHREA